MKRSSLFAAAFAGAFALAGGVASAADDTPATHAGMRMGLSPEQRLVLMQENRDANKSLSDADRKAARQKMRDSWMAMTDAQRDARKTELQKKWDALTPDQQQQLRDQAAQWRAQHQGGGQ